MAHESPDESAGYYVRESGYCRPDGDPNADLSNVFIDFSWATSLEECQKLCDADSSCAAVDMCLPAGCVGHRVNREGRAPTGVPSKGCECYIKQLGGCNVCRSGVVDRTLLAGYWCADALEDSIGGSNGDFEMTQDECLNAGGTWKPYTCGDVQDHWFNTLGPGDRCNNVSSFWNNQAPVSGSPSPVTCCASPKADYTYVYRGCFDHLAGGNVPGNFLDSEVKSVKSLDECANVCKAKGLPLIGITDIDCPEIQGTFDCHCGASEPHTKVSEDACKPCSSVASGSSDKCGACGWKLSVYEYAAKDASQMFVGAVPRGDDSKCRSDDREGGHDCWAGCHGDPFACDAGYTAVVTEETIDVGVETCWKYTCVPSSTCDNSMCTSVGDDCWAYWQRLDGSGKREDMTCAAGFQAVGGTGAAPRLFAADDSKCRSDDGQGGHDCWAGCYDEPFACDGDYTAVVTKETTDDGGETCWKYTCIPAGLCREDKCTSAGNDCWANRDPAIEPMTCARYVTYAGTLLVAAPFRAVRELTSSHLDVQRVSRGWRNWSWI